MVRQEKKALPGVRKELVYQLRNYGSTCPEDPQKKLAAAIVADTLLAVNRLLLSKGLGVRVSMWESADGEAMYCFVNDPLQ